MRSPRGRSTPTAAPAPATTSRPGSGPRPTVSAWACRRSVPPPRSRLRPADNPVRVLLIEDDDRVAGALSVNLTRQQMDVDRVGSAQRALERLRTGARHDVVLLDLGLPDLDGLALCKRIRELCDVPVIMV